MEVRDTVWLVIESYPTLDLVDSDLDIHYADVGTVIGVYETEEKARKVQDERIADNARMVMALECDPVDVEIVECEVQ